MSSRRPLPSYTKERFDRWFAAHKPRQRGSRGKVILWDDTFVRYYEPNIGKASVKVLEACGLEVLLLRDRHCCGRPAFSQGNLDDAARLGQYNLELVAKANSDVPILFLEPSCYSMFAEDYRELKLSHAETVARSFLFEQYIFDLLEQSPDRLRFIERNENVAIHAHCHAKSIVKTGFMAKLAARLPGRRAILLDTGCCGMAGAFGALESKYDLSLQVAAPLIEKVMKQQAGTTIVASGTSCRHQLEHLTPVKPKHMAELLAGALP